MPPVGLYVHIPFCTARCGYCDFATTVGQEDLMDRYLAAVKQEASHHRGTEVQTLFFGGGTPTVLNPEQIHSLFSALKENFDFSEMSEATIEANPESATEPVLKAYQEEGINRISFGVQSTQNKLLKKLDRLHTWEGFQKAYHLARKLGIQNINTDLIFGLPDQTLADWMSTLEDIFSLNPDHISLYALKIEPGTPFEKQGIRIDDDLQADMYLMASEKCVSNGFHHYEISNFSKGEKECRHNLKYWRNEDTIGLGLSAASYHDEERQTNPRGLIDYIRMMEGGKPERKTTVRLGPSVRYKEDLMLGLRLNRGVKWDLLERTHLPIFTEFLKRDLAFLSDGYYRLRPDGWLLSNQLFQYLL